MEKNGKTQIDLLRIKEIVEKAFTKDLERLWDLTSSLILNIPQEFMDKYLPKAIGQLRIMKSYGPILQRLRVEPYGFVTDEAQAIYGFGDPEHNKLKAALKEAFEGSEGNIRYIRESVPWLKGRYVVSILYRRHMGSDTLQNVIEDWKPFAKLTDEEVKTRRGHLWPKFTAIPDYIQEADLATEKWWEEFGDEHFNHNGNASFSTLFTPLTQIETARTAVRPHEPKEKDPTIKWWIPEGTYGDNEKRNYMTEEKAKTHTLAFRNSKFDPFAGLDEGRRWQKSQKPNETEDSVYFYNPRFRPDLLYTEVMETSNIWSILRCPLNIGFDDCCSKCMKRLGSPHEHDGKGDSRDRPNLHQGESIAIAFLHHGKWRSPGSEQIWGVDLSGWGFVPGSRSGVATRHYGLRSGFICKYCWEKEGYDEKKHGYMTQILEFYEEMGADPEKLDVLSHLFEEEDIQSYYESLKETNK